MALAGFWEGLRVRNPLFHEGVSPPDVPPITSEDLDAALRKWPAAWIPRGPFREYDEKDFEFLRPEELARLSELVKGFNAVATELRDLSRRARTDADEHRLSELSALAAVPLRDLLLFFAHDRYLDAEAFRFGKLVEQELGGTLPDGVVELRFLVGKDWSGDPGFYAWAFIGKEDIVTDEKLFAVTRRARPLIEDAMYRVAKGYFAYLSFRGVGEPVAEDEDEEVAA